MRLRRVLSLGFLTGFLVVSSTSFAANTVPITVIGDHPDKIQLAKIVDSNLIANSRKSYNKVIVRVLKNGNNRELIVHTTYPGKYLFDTSKIILAANNSVVAVNREITLDRRIIDGLIGHLVPTCPDSTVDVVFATPCNDIASAVDGVETACNTATAAGLKCKTLIGGEATAWNYKRYLACPNLKGFGNIGHGNTESILLANGDVLNHQWFTDLTNIYLNGLTLYFNSCQVHNSPLEPAIMSAGDRTFVGGNVNLGIGTSEMVFKCFWDEVTDNQMKMGAALSFCETRYYPTSGAHGISGDTGFFKRLIIGPVHPPIRPIGPIAITNIN
ncbi:MAG: hypothetical protein HQK53_18210 [Oligoflexia bacterium]|nr:hypothetical protein [Oligoflexia bacterium]